MSEELKRYSTREIVMDFAGVGPFTALSEAGPRKLGHNPSWVKAADYDALKAQLLAGATPEGWQRLLQLAQRLQARQHKHGLMYQPDHSGHVGDLTVPDMGIPTCPHPDCLLVRSSLPAPPAPAQQEE